jgi:DNA-binding NtrC family response regulator
MNAPLVLVVDDEEQVGMFAAIFLKRAGYQVMRASSASQALEVFTDEVDALLTDWAMPDLTGGELAGRLVAQKPSLHVFFMSGNPELPTQPGLALKPGINFIPKPFGREELIEMLARALAERRDPVPTP